MVTDASALATLLGLVKSGKVIDLSVPLAEDLPGSWPTHMPFQRKLFNYFKDQPALGQPLSGSRGPYHTAVLTIDEHAGTHVDAPAHFIPPPGSGLFNAAEIGTVTVEQLALTDLIGPAAVIDVTALTDTGGPGVSPEITPKHITDWEAKHGQLEPGEIVLFRSDWDKHYVRGPEGSKYAMDSVVLKSGPGWPSPGVPTLELLFGRGIKTIGLDGASVGSSHDGVPPHVWGLGRGMIYVELLANLNQLPPRGALFAFLPLKIQGGSAAPGRGIAIIP